MVEQSGVELDPRGNVAANTLDYQTSLPKVFAAGDMRRGQSLVVWAIREGRQCARAIDEFLMGVEQAAAVSGMTALPSLAEIEAAAALVHSVVPPTPQYCWPLLSRRVGAELWVKHENHTPTGAFKIRGGLVYLDALRRAEPDIAGVISATTGNHGQSVAYAASRLGLAATIVVPHGNSPEKNRAMQGFGANLVEHGHDFQAAYEHAIARAAAERLHLLPSFHPLLVRGVASYGLELFRAVDGLDTVYVPIGLGSGICGVIAARDALGLQHRDRRRGRRERADLCAVLRRRPAGRDQRGRHFCRRAGGAGAGRGGAGRRSAPARRASSRCRRRRCGTRCASCFPTRTTSPRAPAPRRSPRR